MELEELLNKTLINYKEKQLARGEHPTIEEMFSQKEQLEDFAARTKQPMLKIVSWIYKPILPLLKTFVSMDIDSNPRIISNPKKPVIYIPNHISNLDSLILGTSLYNNNFPYPLMAAGDNLFVNKAIDFLFKSCGAFKLKRSKQDSDYFDILQTYIKTNLEEGQSLLYFPEGTRSRTGHLGNFKKGMTRFILKTYFENKTSQKIEDILFVPIGLAYSRVPEDVRFSKNRKSKAEKINLIKDFFSFRKDPIVNYMHVGQPISLNDFFNENPESQEHIGKAVKDLSQYLKQELSKTIPILEQDIYYSAIAHCLESSKTDTIYLKNLRKKINKTYIKLYESYSPKLLKAKESVGDFLSRMHERELLSKDQLKIKIKNKKLIKYYSNKMASFYKNHKPNKKDK